MNNNRELCENIEYKRLIYFLDENDIEYIIGSYHLLTSVVYIKSICVTLFFENDLYGTLYSGVTRKEYVLWENAIYFSLLYSSYCYNNKIRFHIWKNMMYKNTNTSFIRRGKLRFNYL